MRVENVEVLPDPANPRGGHAIIRLKGVWLLPPGATFRLEPADGDTSFNRLRGWPRGDQRPRATRVTGQGIELLVGPEIVDAPDLQPGTHVRFRIQSLDLERQLEWPTLPMSRHAFRRSLSAASRHPSRVIKPASSKPSAASPGATSPGSETGKSLQGTDANAPPSGRTIGRTSGAAGTSAKNAGQSGLASAQSGATTNGKANDPTHALSTLTPRTSRFEEPEADRKGSKVTPPEPQQNESDTAPPPAANRVDLIEPSTAPSPTAERPLHTAPRPTTPAASLPPITGPNSPAHTTNGTGAGTASTMLPKPMSPALGAKGPPPLPPVAQSPQAPAKSRLQTEAELKVIAEEERQRERERLAELERKAAREAEDKHLAARAANMPVPITEPAPAPQTTDRSQTFAAIIFMLLLGALIVPAVLNASGVSLNGLFAPAQPTPQLAELGRTFAVGDVSPAGVPASGLTASNALQNANRSLYGLSGAKRDRREAEFWLRTALSRRLDDASITWALTQLGTIYASPEGETQADYHKARLLWEIAAAHDDALANCFLARLHEYGLGGPVDKDAALKHYRKTETLGGSEASGCVGLDTALTRLQAD